MRMNNERVCDGCKNTAVSWKFWKDGIYVGGKKVIDLTLPQLNRALLTSMNSFYTGGMTSEVNAPIFCMCPECWSGMAKSWGKAEGKSADVYKPARAKTNATGVFFSN